MTTIDINTIIDISIMNASKVQREYYTGFMNEKVVVFIYDIDNTVEAVINSQEIVNVNDINTNNENSESKQEDFGIMELYQCNMEDEIIVDSNVNNEDIMDKSNDEVGEEEIFHYSLVEHDLKFIPNDCSGDLVQWEELEKKASKKTVLRWNKGENKDVLSKKETDLPSIQKFLNWFDKDRDGDNISQFPVCREIERVVLSIGKDFKTGEPVKFYEVYYKDVTLPEIHKAERVENGKKVFFKLGRVTGMIEQKDGSMLKVEGAGLTIDSWLINGVLLKKAQDGSDTFGKIHTNSKGVKTIEFGKSTGATPNELFENLDIGIIQQWMKQALCKEVFVDRKGNVEILGDCDSVQVEKGMMIVDQFSYKGPMWSAGYVWAKPSYKAVYNKIIKAVDGLCSAATFDWQYKDEVEETIENCISSVESDFIKESIKIMDRKGVARNIQALLISKGRDLAWAENVMDETEAVSEIVKDIIKKSVKVKKNIFGNSKLAPEVWGQWASMFNKVVWGIYQINKLLVSWEEEVEEKGQMVKVITYKMSFFWSMARNYVSRKFRQAQQQAWSDCQSPDRVVEHEFALAQEKRVRRESAKKLANKKSDTKYYGDIE
jgi:hypothetical protein